MHRQVEFILLMRLSRSTSHTAQGELPASEAKTRTAPTNHVEEAVDHTTTLTSQKSVHVSSEKSPPSQPLEEPNHLVLFLFVTAPLESGKSGDDESKRTTDEDVKG